MPTPFAPTISIADAAKALGVATSTVYQSINHGTFPSKVLRVGTRIVIPTAPFLEALGLDGMPDFGLASGADDVAV